MHNGIGRVLFLACLCAWAVSGCAHVTARTEPSPALDVPTAPPRDVEPAAVPTTEEAPAPTPAPEPPSIPESRRGAAPRPPAPPREQPPAEAPKPPAVAATPTKPPATLQTTPAAADEELERGIRTTLVHASAELDRCDYRRLGADARIQYDTAKRFILQAEDAVRDKNLVFARNLADKALTLAIQLSGK